MLARSTVNRGEARPLWDQDFAFEDLEGREEVRLIVWKERKMGREGKVGECNVGGRGVGREGETMEGWYPLVHGSQYAGELKVRVTFTEQILFSRGYYRELEEVSRFEASRSLFPSPEVFADLSVFAGSKRSNTDGFSFLEGLRSGGGGEVVDEERIGKWDDGAVGAELDRGGRSL